jgi:hypothetical protein
MNFPSKQILSVLSLLLMGASLSWAGSSVGIKYGADISEMFPDEICGVVPQSNWNNAKEKEGTVEELVDEAGNKTKIKTVWSVATTWGKSKAGDPPDARLFHGRLEGGSGGQPATVSVEGIPYKSYSLYIYFSTGEKYNGTSNYKVNETMYTVSPGPFDGEFKMAEEAVRWHPEADKRGNYVVIPDMTGDVFIETSSEGWQNDASGDFRSPICAIQIVEKKD